MLNKLIDGNAKWYDMYAPRPADIEEIAKHYEMPETIVQDCLDVSHPPKIEKINDTTFIIVRAHDPECHEGCITDVELTRRLAILIRNNDLVTMHRKDLGFLSIVEQKWRSKPCNEEELVPRLLNDLMKAIVFSYEKPLEEIESRLTKFESQIFEGQPSKLLTREIYYIKQMLEVYKRTLRQNLDVIYKLDDFSEQWHSIYRDLREEATRTYQFAEHLIENLTSLFNMHLSLETQKVNEVIRILTLFSVFFMPLTFIVGVYGMNFKTMPEIEWQYGYYAVWALMLAVTGALLMWFKSKGWVSFFK